MKKTTLFMMPALLGLMVSTPVSAASAEAALTTSVTAAVTADGDTPATLAETFFENGTVKPSADGGYTWMKYQVKTTGRYVVGVGHNSKASVKVTNNGDLPVSSIEEATLTKDNVNYEQRTPSVRVKAGEYLYFGIKSTFSESVYISESDEVIDYAFGDPVITPANESEVADFSSITIAYPDVETSNEDATVGLFSGDASTGMSYIPAELFEGKLEETYGSTSIAQTYIYLTNAEDGTPQLTLSFDAETKPDTWYTIVIPANVLTFCKELFPGYVIPIDGAPTVGGFNLYYKVKGADKIAFVGSSIAQDDTLDRLSVVPVWTDRAVTAAEGAKMALYDGETVVKEAPLSVLPQGEKTLVLADFTDEAHAALALRDSVAYTLVLPAGSLVSADGSLESEALTIAFSGPIQKVDTVEVPVEVPVQPDMLKFTYIAGDKLSTTFDVVKEKSITVEISPEEGWKVETLTLDDLDVLAELDGTTYTSPALSRNWTLRATFVYDGFTYEEGSTGVVEVPGTTLTAYSNEGQIIVTGITTGSSVKVYTIGGSLIGSFEATKDRAEISVPQGQTYIVVVGDNAMKVLNR